MTNIFIIVRTRRGFRKACIRGFVGSVQLSINPSNGRDLDRSSEIAEAFHRDKEGLNNYFKEKEDSIRRDYRQDSNSAAVDGVQASELHSWQVNRDDLLEQLNDQKDDVFDLASVYDSNSDDEGSSVNSNSSNNNNASSPGNRVNETSNVNEAESVSENSSYYPQDSSDVAQTDFSSFEPFED
jgi:hypothetical protein